MAINYRQAKEKVMRLVEQSLAAHESHSYDDIGLHYGGDKCLTDNFTRIICMNASRR